MQNFSSSLYGIHLNADKRLKEITEEAETKVAAYFKIPSYLFKPFKYVIRRLPAVYEVRIKRIGSYVLGCFRKIGKILGIFDSITDEIYIDPLNLTDPALLRRTLIHELVHRAQKLLGKLGKYSRYYLEREAYMVTKKLMD